MTRSSTVGCIADRIVVAYVGKGLERGDEVSVGGQPSRWSEPRKFTAGAAVVMLLSLRLCGVALSQNHKSGGLALAGSGPKEPPQPPLSGSG